MASPPPYEFTITTPVGRWLVTYKLDAAADGWLRDGQPKLIESFYPPPKLPDALERYPDGRPVHPELTPAPQESSAPIMPDLPRHPDLGKG